MADVLHPLHQLSIDVCKTITPNKFYIEKNVHIPLADGLPIDQRSMLHCYIQEVSHIAECTYTHDRLTPPAN